MVSVDASLVLSSSVVASEPASPPVVSLPELGVGPCVDETDAAVSSPGSRHTEPTHTNAPAHSPSSHRHASVPSSHPSGMQTFSCSAQLSPSSHVALP